MDPGFLPTRPEPLTDDDFATADAAGLMACETCNVRVFVCVRDALFGLAAHVE